MKRSIMINLSALLIALTVAGCASATPPPPTSTPLPTHTPAPTSTPEPEVTLYYSDPAQFEIISPAGTRVLILDAGLGTTLLALRTADGGETWVRESVPATNATALYLSRDGLTLTVANFLEIITLRYTE